VKWLPALALLCSCACSQETAQVPVPGQPGAFKSSAALRAERRLFDGAPPIIPHPPLGAACTQCHHQRGMDVPGLGFAPPSPHEQTPGMSALSRCQQCHLHASQEADFAPNSFQGLAQDLRPGERAWPGAPPHMPHPRNMRENCLACHDGPAAREEIRCSHPERARCEQCHLPQHATDLFRRP
jgi:cytochrome c-type protein NapB